MVDPKGDKKGEKGRKRAIVQFNTSEIGKHRLWRQLSGDSRVVELVTRIQSRMQGKGACANSGQGLKRDRAKPNLKSKGLETQREDRNYAGGWINSSSAIALSEQVTQRHEL